MGKQGKLKFGLFGFLPKAASTVTFLSPPSSPRMANTSKGSSGPIISLVPKEARRKARSGSFDAREPTSPKVSCMGQVKNKKKIKSQESQPTQVTKSDSCPEPTPTVFNRKKQGLKSDTSHERSPVAEKVLSLGHMKQFSSNRGVLRDFDWKAHGVSGMRDNPIYCSDDEKKGNKEKVPIVAYSEPVEVGGDIPLEPKKEVNLWKRRSKTPPRPLQLEN